MDSYVKMWLQLFFPCFLIFIAVFIIISSRYSTRILRLTYARSLPVLATLFLLSYTGVLRVVLNVLFSYHVITQLPNNHQQRVWSIDASIPLFGLKFTVLFITCLVLFLILISFNIILFFTRYLSKFRAIYRFKPILDAFQGSYKDKYYYWIAVHVILRAVFFALKALNQQLMLVLTTIILVLFTVYYASIHPYNSKLANTQELLFLINLIIMYAVSYQQSERIFTTIANIMISLAFIQFCITLLYHFLTYTIRCKVIDNLYVVLENLKHFFKLKTSTTQQFTETLDIPERTFNYTAYQDGLISDDFVAS